ncbi:hypothetical protein BAE44_0007126 [Dichanthelium oligosanthes]|uniref:Uncharacterized protein n=1 Tax=Dichanthelium oligosanthes TaxID=888268 RepID=A0A1E5W3H3_9POAL|nr:hypothetical protein BAE44_0007126 [Dichanthelium oligosanthes]
MEAGGGRRRRLSAREEELLGLLAGFPDGSAGGESASDRELSFSDLVEAGARPTLADAAPAPREGAGAAVSSPGRHETAAASKQQRQQAARQRARRSGGAGSRGSCGGGGDGVLLNFYVPGLLTRSMTAPRPGRGPLSPGAGPKPAAAAAVAGKASRSVTVKPTITRFHSFARQWTQAPFGIGCWPALWGRGRERRRPPAKACS